MVRIILILIFLGIGFAQNWYTNLQEGIQKAKKEDRLVLIYFYSEHCPYCHQVEEFLFGDPEVDKFLKKNFVVVAINYAQDKQMVKRFEVYGTPTFVILEPKNGRVLKKVFGSVPKDQFMPVLINACNKSLRRC